MPVKGQLKGLMIATTTPIRRRSVALWPQQWLFLAEGCARHARSPSPNPHYESFFVRKRRKTLRAEIGAHTSVRKTRAAQIQAGRAGKAVRRPCTVSEPGSEKQSGTRWDLDAGHACRGEMFFFLHLLKFSLSIILSSSSFFFFSWTSASLKDMVAEEKSYLGFFPYQPPEEKDLYFSALPLDQLFYKSRIPWSWL